LERLTHRLFAREREQAFADIWTSLPFHSVNRDARPVAILPIRRSEKKCQDQMSGSRVGVETYLHAVRRR
jgi:hypothetical protein